MSAAHHLTFLQAIVIGGLQGVTELFPISSLGHAVLLPHWLGGDWARNVGDESVKESPYLAFIVVLHVATAAALLVFFWREWIAIVRGLFRSIARRKIETVHERMAWLLVIATIPAGLTGLVLEHAFRVLFAKPLAAAIFLTVNGFILFGGERLRRRALDRAEAEVAPARESTGDELDAAVVRRVRPLDAAWIGTAQVLALLAGISRSGITMVTGLARGLDHEQAVRFSFLLATPIILAAGVLKIPDFTGHLGDGIRGQALAGAAVAFVAALLATKFLTRFFRSGNLNPFAVYCLVAGGASIIRFA
ncbi:MAG TPA: undecaprenyl-diphosphate phosphatase [Mycobacteriales bacterium]|nr:undecaprenyl-diphosphate phosphatase [Mycobacteriales bacterium]